MNEAIIEKLYIKGWEQLMNEAIIEKLDIQGYIYGYMYGQPYIQCADGNKRKDKIIKIEKDELRIGKNKNCFVYIWGWPGPDANIYYFDDYGITWSFNENDLLDEEEL